MADDDHEDRVFVIRGAVSLEDLVEAGLQASHDLRPRLTADRGEVEV